MYALISLGNMTPFCKEKLKKSGMYTKCEKSAKYRGDLFV